MKYRKFIMILFSSGLISAQEIDPRYHTFQEIGELLDSLSQVDAYQDWFRVDTIGYSSHEGLPILAVKISDNVSVKEDEPRVLFVGQVHAEEILGVETVLGLMMDLLDPDASEYNHMNTLRSYLEIWLVPTANPEGMNVVHDGLDLTFRKNKRDFSADGPTPNGVFDYEPSIGNDIDGVDLNRNFDFNWIFGDGFLAPDESDYGSHFDYYRGPEPFSEAEAVALKDLAIEQGPVFSIIWHSSRSGNLSEKVFTSWHWADGKESPDLGIMKLIADEFSGLIEKEDGTGTYLSVYSESRNGKAHDWFYRETGCFQYLVECGTENLQPDSALIEDTIDRTRPAMVYLMDRAIGYFTDAAQATGIVYDGATGQPVEGAIIEVMEHTGSVLRPRLTDEFGRYRRVLDVGTYTLSVRAEGYLSQQVTVVLNNSGMTERDVQLVAAPTHTLQLILDFNPMPISLVGLIANEFGTDSVWISYDPGGSLFELYEGEYTITVPGEFDWIPWERTVDLGQDLSITVPIDHGSPVQLSGSWPWESAQGPWSAGNVVLRSQEGIYYDNADSTLSTQWMESGLIDISGTNRAVVAVSHRFETEWDHDPVTVSILDENDSVRGSRSWTGDRWGDHQTDLVTAIGQPMFSQVRVRLEFSPDQTVNYRGWELQELSIYSIYDEYLGVAGSSGNVSPKIPMSISTIYPNPSNGRFQIDLANFPGGQGTVRVFNLLGQEIRNYDLNGLSPGRHFLDMDTNGSNGRPMGSGMVFVRVETKKEQVIRKCVILNN